MTIDKKEALSTAIIVSILVYALLAIIVTSEPAISKIYTFIGIVNLIGVAVWWIVWAEIHAV